MMYAKLWVVVTSLAAISVALLGLRQKRLEVMHEIAVLNRQMNSDRQQMWDLQVRVAQDVSPPRLETAIDRCGLLLETPGQDEQPFMTAQWHHAQP